MNGLLLPAESKSSSSVTITSDVQDNCKNSKLAPMVSHQLRYVQCSTVFLDKGLPVGNLAMPHMSVHSVSPTVTDLADDDPAQV